MKSTAQIVQAFDSMFNEIKCHELCRQCFFIQRSSSKLQGYEFIKAMIVPSEGLPTDSLKGLCSRIKKFNSKAILSAQALSLKINNVRSSTLMKAVFREIISQIHQQVIEKCPRLEIGLEGIQSVYIQDSSVIRLNEKLQTVYKGTNRGRCGPKAQMKIDLIHEIKEGKLVEAKIYQGSKPDQKLSEQILKHIKPGDLVIRDLGYFVLNIFKAIAELGGYFLSRLNPGVKFFLKREDKEPLDIGKFLIKNHRNKNVIELTGFLGDEKVPTRLITYRQSEETTAKRIRIAKKHARCSGKTMSKGKLLSLNFSMFVTNCPREILSAERIGTIYRLRWEIELIFKRWKSQLQIDYLKGTCKERIDCLIWSRLCTVILIELIKGYVEKIVRKMFTEELSEVKLIGYLLRNSNLYNAIFNNRLNDFFTELEKDIPKMLLKDKRKRKTIREKVYTKESYYEILEVKNECVA